jgi:hypothetical protein
VSKSNRIYVVVVLEDVRHEMFVRRYLKRLGVGEREMRIERSPSGEGSAEQWVKTRFAKEVSAYRNRQARAASALILMIDADAYSVRDRLAQLDQALRDGGKQIVAEGERIARLVPKRNGETWILCLNGQRVDEETDYKATRKDWTDLIPLAAETLSVWTRPDTRLPNYCIDSLRSGAEELKRLSF